MLYTRSWQYAVRILVHLAGLAPGEQQSARVIARAIGVPAPFACKILSVLAGARLVRSRRGPRGGVMLARPPGEISVNDIVRAVGEHGAIGECILGFRECNDQIPCPVHETWGAMRERLRSVLLDRTLADFHAIMVAAAKGRTLDDRARRGDDMSRGDRRPRAPTHPG